MSTEQTKPVKKQDIKWAAVLWYIHLHVLGLYATWLLLTSAKWPTVFFTILITSVGCLGVTVGAHRLWAHATFKASWPLRFFLMMAHTLAGVIYWLVSFVRGILPPYRLPASVLLFSTFSLSLGLGLLVARWGFGAREGPIYDWVLYHRLHHKYYGTDKDPYNHKKGFWYSHYASNFLSPNVDYEQAKIAIDMRDLDEDRFVTIQKEFYWLLFGIFGLLLPLNAPLEYWDESMALTVLITGILRFAITVNVSWLVNSALLVWGSVTTDLSRNSISMFFITKSYWPSYHYMVPWDWKSSEFGQYATGCSSFFIKLWYELGWVNHLQTAATDDTREILHAVARKKFSLQEGLEKLKDMAEYNARKESMTILS